MSNKEVKKLVKQACGEVKEVIEKSDSIKHDETTKLRRKMKASFSLVLRQISMAIL